MKKFSSLAGIGFALALAAAALPARAQNPVTPPEAAQAPGADGAPGAWLEGPAAARLGLSDAQKASCQAIIDKHRTPLVQKRQAAGEARRTFREAFLKPDTTPDTLRKLHRTMADQEFEQQLERRALRQELRAVLTPEQREKAAWMEGRMEAHRRGGGCGDGSMARVRRGMRPEPPAAPAP